MKKTITLIVSILVLCAMTVSGFATVIDSVRFVEDSPTFDIEMQLPEGASVGQRYDDKLVSLVEIVKDGVAPVLITIAPSEIYDETESFSNMKEEAIKEYADSIVASDPGSSYTIEKSTEGNPYIFVHTETGENTFYDTIHGLYHGYCLTLSQFSEDFSELSEKDTEFMLKLLKNIHFIELNKSGN